MPRRDIFYKTQSAWQGVKLTRLVSIFTSKKVWNFLIKKSAEKIWSKKEKGWKVPCLMPIRVNSPHLWSRHKKDGSRAGGRIPFPVFKLCRRQRSVWNSWDCSSKVFSLLAGSITEVGIKAWKCITFLRFYDFLHRSLLINFALRTRKICSWNRCKVFFYVA